MPTKYFEAASANRLIAGKFSFDIYDIIGGTPFGIYATSVEADQAVLIERGPALGVEEITEARYAELKKKAEMRQDSPKSSYLRQQPPQVAITGAGAVVVEEKESSLADEPAAVKPVEATSVDEVILLESTKPEPLVEIPIAVAKKVRKTKVSLLP